MTSPDLTLRDAIRLRNHEQVRDALDAGADVNAVDPTGLTPLHHAVLHLNPVAMVLLRQRGASPTAQGPDGCSGAQWLEQVPDDLDPTQMGRWKRSAMAWALWCHPHRHPPVNP
jgi:ankyrin repeat protein